MSLSARSLDNLIADGGMEATHDGKIARVPAVFAKVSTGDRLMNRTIARLEIAASLRSPIRFINDRADDHMNRSLGVWRRDQF